MSVLENTLLPVSASPLSHQAGAACSLVHLKKPRPALPFHWLLCCPSEWGLVSCGPARRGCDQESDRPSQRSCYPPTSQGALGSGCWGFWEMSPAVVVAVDDVVFLETAATGERKNKCKRRKKHLLFCMALTLFILQLNSRPCKLQHRHLLPGGVLG